MTDEKKPEQEASDQPTQSTSQSASSDAPSSNKVDVVSTAPAAVKPAPKTAQPNKAEKNAAKLGWIAKLVIFLAFLLALAACLGVGYMLYQQHQELATKVEERQQQARESQAQANAISTMQAEMKTLTQQLKLERDAIKSANQNRELLQSRMSTLEKEIATVTGSHRIDWMLREVEHFINVAEQRLSLLGDARGALALMLEADDIVRAMGEPTARPLREALVKDIHELKLAAETSVDTDGIFLRISDLAKRVDQLGLPHYEMRQEAPVDTMSEDMPEDGLELLGARFVTFLGSLFRYQKHVKSKPMLLSAERDYLAQSIVLLLHQAQLALLRGDNTAYHLSLTEARERIGLYVRQQTKETQFFITEVTALGAIQLRPEVPTIEASSRAVRVFREFWNKEKLIREQETMALQRENAK
ncbi:MAG: uroporphyrinogen-III C-methyltransferase [Pseudomonadales bacterium]|nr:uroporphyrinogen-III C-methyltransferase [Pseudomonadales bacterium]